MKKYVNIIIAFIFCFSTNIYANNNINDMLDVDTCSITINQNDTTIYSNTPIQLQFTSDIGANSYKWYPSTGLSNDTINNPIATINNSTQYILAAIYESELDSNLVYNGDFELGNVGFTTGYRLNNNYWPSYTCGDYNILLNPTDIHPMFFSCTNGGYFIVADAALTPNVIIYQTTINVEPNTYYRLSTECLNIWPESTQEQNPRLQFQINSQQIGNVFTIINTNCDWNRFSGIWNSGSNTTATIKIIDQNTTLMGNDFALDNVSLRKLCVAHDTINITILTNSPIIPREVNVSLCENDFPYTYYDSIFTQAGTYGYSFTTNNIVDSLHIVNITLLPSYNDTIFASICSGQTYTENGFNVKDAGFYTNTSTTVNGCDSIINLSFNVQPVEDTIINAVICEGNAYNQYGFNESNSGTYYNYYSFGEECERKLILNLIVIEYPEMLLLPDSVINVEEYPITIDATCLGCDNYIWSNGVLSPLINIYHQGTYYICVESSCGNYCDSVIIKNPEVNIFLPNSFTPSIESNSTFGVYTEEGKVSLETFAIYNRWGEKVFETKEINKSWDGTYKGKLCNSDVFVWKILYKTKYTGDDIFEKIGEVTLVR